MKNTLTMLILLFLSNVTHAQQTEGYRYTAWQCYNLKGDVRTMITSTGDTLRFDRQGELIDRDGNRPLDFSDEWREPFVISFPDEYTRYESKMPDILAAKVENRFIFDYKGRITKKFLSPHYVIRYEEVYVYPDDGDSDFPRRVIVDDSDEEFHTFRIFDYEYQSFDEKGNWISRQVRSWTLEAQTMLWGDEKPVLRSGMKEYEETAEYAYY